MNIKHVVRYLLVSFLCFGMCDTLLSAELLTSKHKGFYVEKARIESLTPLIFKKLATYFINHKFNASVLQGKPLSVSIQKTLVPIIKYKGVTTAFLSSKLEMSTGKSYTAVFRIALDCSNNDFIIDLLYLTNGDPISPTLFFDVVDIAFPNLAQQHLNASLKECDVFIDTVEGTNESRSQKWTFATPSKSKSVQVNLTIDGRGGTNFDIQDYKD